MEGMITESIECTDFTCHFCPSWETRAGRSVGLKVLLSSCPELRQGFHSEQRTWISAGLNSLCYTSFRLCGFYMYIGNTFNRMGSFHRLPLHRSPSLSWSARIHKGSKVAIQRTHIINLTPKYFLEKDYYRLALPPSLDKIQITEQRWLLLCSLHSGCVRLLANTLLLLELISTWINTIFFSALGT